MPSKLPEEMKADASRGRTSSNSKTSCIYSLFFLLPPTSLPPTSLPPTSLPPNFPPPLTGPCAKGDEM